MQGDIAVRVPDPVMFIGYWRNDAATRAKFRGEWLVTGDTGIADDEEFIRFVDRDDDVITSVSYRIGPRRSKTACCGIRLCAWLPWSARRTRNVRRRSPRLSCSTTALRRTMHCARNCSNM